MSPLLSAIFPLIGVLIGGFLSYFTSLLLKKREIKVSMEKTRCEKVYIPICTAIEEVKSVSFGTDSGDYGEVIAYNYDNDEWNRFRTFVDRSLLAASRPYLTKESIIRSLKFRIPSSL